MSSISERVAFLPEETRMMTEESRRLTEQSIQKSYRARILVAETCALVRTSQQLLNRLKGKL